MNERADINGDPNEGTDEQLSDSDVEQLEAVYRAVVTGDPDAAASREDDLRLPAFSVCSNEFVANAIRRRHEQR